MQEWIQLTIDGLTLGGVYAVIALGYTLVYGVLRMINFAHGELFMMGAFAGFYTLDGFEQHSDLNDALPVLTITVAIAAGMATSVTLAILMERIAYRPLRHAPRLAPLISAIGVSIFLRNVMLRWTNARREIFPSVFPAGAIEIGDVRVTYIRLFLIGLSLLFLLYVWDVSSLHLWAALFGLNYISTVPPTTTLTANIYGRFSVGELSGWIFFAHQVGAALGAAAAGWIFELTGSYASAFVSAAILGFVAAGLALMIREEPVRARPLTPAPAV